MNFTKCEKAIFCMSTNGCNVSLACVNSKECLVVSLIYFDKLFAHEDYNTSTYLSCDLQIVEDIILD